MRRWIGVQEGKAEAVEEEVAEAEVAEAEAEARAAATAGAVLDDMATSG
jgi:hypothetical protein